MKLLIGKDQVSVGVVAVNFSHSSSESSGSVYPLAIGNCKENRLVVEIQLLI